MADHLIADDDRFWSLVVADAPLEHLAGGGLWTEGPVYLPTTDEVVWSDIPNDRMLVWSARDGARVFRAPSEFVNGNTLDREGRIVHCSHGARSVQRTEHDGTVVTLVDRWQGKKLNSPNDLVVRADGTIWFTDPQYGIKSDYEGHAAPSEIGANYVYRFDPASGALDAVITDMDEPNGLAFSPDGTRLYVADTSGASRPDGFHHIRVYDVDGAGDVGEGRLFVEIEPGLADGFRLDLDGNIWTSSLDSIQVYDPSARRIGRIMVPERLSNCCWGGPDADVLYITASTSLYRIAVRARGHGLHWTA